MPLLARLAAEPEGRRLGPGVLLLRLLSPVLVAEECAPLDWMCGGKAIIGLGLGYRKEEFASIGVPFKERVPRFVESVELIRKLWRDDTVEHHGRFHSVSGVPASLKPQQKGGPPIWMAGDVEVAVKRAARLGDAWMPSPMVSEDNVGTLDEVLEPLSFKYEAYASWGGESGFVPAEGIRSNFDKFAAKRFLIGSESQLVEQVGRYGAQTGTDHILLRVQWPGLGQKMVLRTLERLGRVVEQLK